MSPELQLAVLGRPQISRDGVPISGFVSAKALALLCYLAVTGQTYTREALAALLWGDSPDSKARANLRTVLANLRQLVGPYIEIEQDGVRFNRACSYWLDVELFESLLATGITDSSLQLISQAIELYRGDFLEGFRLRHAPDFEEWQRGQQERCHQMAVQALGFVSAQHLERGEFAAAIDYTRRLLALEPWLEEAHRQLMLLLAKSGQRSAALAQYDICRRVLAEELDIEPSAETEALYERLKTAAAPRPHNLPPPTTPFVGREQELAHLVEYFSLPVCRLICLVGLGGVGKTRLALEAGMGNLALFHHGVFFVPLAAVETLEGVVSHIAGALNFSFNGLAEPKTQLLNFLHAKNLLLILDNFEQLLPVKGGLELLLDLLQAAPELKLLVTSRERLNIREEWVVEVGGLVYPGRGARDRLSTPEARLPGTFLQVPISQLHTYSAIALFLQHARRLQAEFALTETNQADVVRLCQLAQGMPLGLELAATWLPVLTCGEIVAEIERDLNFLATSARNVPERHRSMRAVFESSWHLLSETERKVLKRLSIFRGGFQREAGIQVAGASLPLLLGLLGKSLLRRDETGRYDMHELIRQFAEERLQTNLDEYETTQDLYSAYYIEFLQQQTDDARGQHQIEAISAIVAEITNVRIAWRWAVARRDASKLKRAVEGLWLIGEYQGSLYETELAFSEAMAAFTQADSAGIKAIEGCDSLVGLLLAGQGWFRGRRGQLKEGRALMEQGIFLLRRSAPPDSRKETMLLVWLGFLCLYQGEFAEAYLLGQECMTAASELNDSWAMVSALLLLSTTAQTQGQPEQAEQFLQQSLKICQKQNNPRQQSIIYYNLGIIATMLGSYAQAGQYLDRAVEFSYDLNDKVGMVSIVVEQGKLAVALGQYSQAIQTLQNGLALLEELGSKWNIEAMLACLGLAFRLQGDLVEAERLLQQSLASAQAISHPMQIAVSLSQLGCLAFDRGHYRQAEHYQQEALAIWQELKHEPEIASALRYLGHAAAVSGEEGRFKAGEYYKQALQLAITHRLAPLALDLFAGMAELLVQAQETQRAVELLALAEHHPASMRETRDKARRYLKKLEKNGLRPEIVMAAKTRAETTSWEALAVEL